jgi:hypothetical protein
MIFVSSAGMYDAAEAFTQWLNPKFINKPGEPFLAVSGRFLCCRGADTDHLFET